MGILPVFAGTANIGPRAAVPTSQGHTVGYRAFSELHPLPPAKHLARSVADTTLDPRKKTIWHVWPPLPRPYLDAVYAALLPFLRVLVPGLRHIWTLALPCGLFDFISLPAWHQSSFFRILPPSRRQSHFTHYTAIASIFSHLLPSTLHRQV